MSEDQPYHRTRLFSVYLELRNVSPVANPFEIYFDPSHAFNCRLLDERDKALPTAGLSTDILTPPPFWLSLPYDSRLRFRVSVNGFGLPSNAGGLIPMLCGEWLVDSRTTNSWLEATFVVNPPQVDLNRRVWKGKLKLPRVKVPG